MLDSLIRKLCRTISSTKRGSDGLCNLSSWPTGSNVRPSEASINVNGVAPTVVRTRMASDWDDPEVHRRLLERIPLGRIAEVDDVSGPVLFFLGPASAFVTGQVLYVDGGITATQ